MTTSQKVLYVLNYVKAHNGRVEFDDRPYMRLVARLDEALSNEYDEELVLEYFDSTDRVDYALMIALNSTTGAMGVGQQLWTGNRLPISPRQFIEKFEQIFGNHFMKIYLENL